MSKLRKFGEFFLEELAVEFGLEPMMEEIVALVNEKVTVDSLYKAIKEGTHIWDVTPKKYKRIARRYAKILKRFRKYSTPKNWFKVLSEKRSDLASLILNMPKGKGIAWWEKEIEHLNKQIFGE